MSKGIETVAVIPAFNEENTVGDVVRAALRATQIDAVVIVDDGSEDMTHKNSFAAAKLESSSKEFSIIEHASNRGKTETLCSGVEQARLIGGSTLSTLVFLDADSSPIWTRDTRGNMKLWQIAANSLSGTFHEPLSEKNLEGRRETFITLLARYIDEIAEPVVEGQEIMRVGMYERNAVTDTFLMLFEQGAHGGNRALNLEIWDGLIARTKENLITLRPWEIEGALETYISQIVQSDSSQKVGTFIMRSVVNVGSRVKAGGVMAGLNRMREIHTQALRGRQKLLTKSSRSPHF